MRQLHRSMCRSLSECNVRERFAHAPPSCHLAWTFGYQVKPIFFCFLFRMEWGRVRTCVRSLLVLGCSLFVLMTIVTWIEIDGYSKILHFRFPLPTCWVSETESGEKSSQWSDNKKRNWPVLTLHSLLLYPKLTKNVWLEIQISVWPSGCCKTFPANCVCKS